jgi:hypothetical protein
MCSECKFECLNDLIQINCNGNSYLLGKIADKKNAPLGDFTGKTELGQRIKDKNPCCFLFYIYISHNDKDLILSYSDTLATIAVEKTHPVFRMPNSPYYSFILIDIKNPGIITVYTDNTEIKDSINLACCGNELEEVNFFWQDKRIASPKFPKKFYGIINTK